MKSVSLVNVASALVPGAVLARTPQSVPVYQWEAGKTCKKAITDVINYAKAFERAKALSCQVSSNASSSH